MTIGTEKEMADTEKLKSFLIDWGIPDTTFMDVAGLEDIKESIKKALSFCDLLISNKIDHEYPGKILLHGPPGTGKTLLAKATAGQCKCRLIELRLSTIISEFLGNTQKNMALVFDYLKKIGIEEMEKHKRWIVFFMDEFDYLAKDRGNIGELGDMKRLVNVILKEFDELNFSKYYVFTICATNHEKMLDSAVWRRFNIVKRVGLPNEFERTEMIEMFLANFAKLGVLINQRPLIVSDLVKITDNYSGSEIRRAIDEIIVIVITDQKKEVNHEVFMNCFQKSKSQSLIEVFSSDIGTNISYPNPLMGDMNPLLFEDLLIKYISNEKKYKDLIQSAMMFDNLNESTKKLLMTLNFCLFYQPKVQEYLTNLRKRSFNQGR